MSPTLFSFDLGGHELSLHTYGALVALGFALGIGLFWREGKRKGLDGGRLLDLALWGVVAGLLDSPLAFVGLNVGESIDACSSPGRSFAGASTELSARISGCTAALRFWDGAFVFYGGALVTGMVALLFCRREGRLSGASATWRPGLGRVAGGARAQKAR
ncbi:MAG: prolipoprotein diacylglyceryl transferase family protein [Myxococcales bacterium]